MKNFGMDGDNDTRLGPLRPRHATGISTSAHQLHCHVERKRKISGYFALCGVKKRSQILRFAQNDNVLLFCIARGFANP
jgi:hypothetical protein